MIDENDMHDNNNHVYLFARLFENNNDSFNIFRDETNQTFTFDSFYFFHFPSLPSSARTFYFMSKLLSRDLPITYVQVIFVP